MKKKFFIVLLMLITTFAFAQADDRLNGTWTASRGSIRRYNNGSYESTIKDLDYVDILIKGYYITRGNFVITHIPTHVLYPKISQGWLSKSGAEHITKHSHRYVLDFFNETTFSYTISENTLILQSNNGNPPWVWTKIR